MGSDREEVGWIESAEKEDIFSDLGGDFIRLAFGAVVDALLDGGAAAFGGDQIGADFS